MVSALEVPDTRLGRQCSGGLLESGAGSKGMGVEDPAEQGAIEV
jgi:hypothetical protein